MSEPTPGPWYSAWKRPVMVGVRGPIAELESIETLEGTMQATIGDFIVRGVRGECYPVKPDIFAETYDLFPTHDALIGAARPAADLLDNLLSRVRGFEFWEEHPYAAGIARD